MLNVYLFFNGNCEEAMNFYKNNIEGSTIENIQKYGDTQMPSSEAYKDKVMHGLMHISGTKIMCSDSGEKRDVNVGDNFSLALDFKHDGDMQRAFDNLSGHGGRVTMPLQDTFWGAKFGMCVDKFGVNWMFNHEKNKGQ